MTRVPSGLVASALLLAGCGGAAQRETASVAGQVTFKGKPVPAGFINFTPDIAGGNSGETRGFPITDGRYDTAQGATPGIYPGANIIFISGFDGKPVPPLWPQGKQVFNPVELKDTLQAGGKDFVIPESAGKNVQVTPMADPPGGM